jgi:hypothetical protein
MDRSFLDMLTSMSAQITKGFAEIKDPIMNTAKTTEEIYKSIEGKFVVIKYSA